MIELNVQQQSVVNAPVDENLVVIAGAGTGKTRVIISRIGRLLQESHVRPDQILAISFSKDTKAELKQRIDHDLGYYSSKIRLGTFNSLGWRILNFNRQAAGLAQDTKVRTDNEMWFELKQFFRKRYDLNLLVRAKEESAFQVDAVLGAESHKNLDNELHGALYRSWNALSQGQKGLGDFSSSLRDIPLPIISVEHYAQIWSLLFFPSIVPDLNTQVTNFRVLGQNPAYSAVIDQMAQSYKLFFKGMWNALQQQPDFKLGPQWQAAMFLNHGAPDVSANCWLELSMWCNQRDSLGKLNFVFEPERSEFSMQELTTYVIKRKEEGALPRIGFEKFQYYKEHLAEAWAMAYPCDLIRLKIIAPEKFQKYLQCPFKKDFTKSLSEQVLSDSISELQNTLNSMAYHDQDGQNQDRLDDKGNKHANKNEHIKVTVAQSDGASKNVSRREARAGAGAWAGAGIGADANENGINPNVKDLSLLFVNGALNEKQEEATGNVCSCSFCPFFLDWYELLFAIYEEWREERHYIDFPEQINRCVRLLRQDHAIRERQQQQLKFIFVDEFQDTNNMQYEMLSLLKTDNTVPKFAQNYLCVVGDDDQSIYCWRGANMRCLERIMHHMHLSPEQLKMLTINYRSHQNILNVANSLILHNSYRLLAKRLVCPQAFAFEQMHPEMQIGFDPSSPRVNIVGFESYKLEGRAVVQAISYLHDDFKVPYHEIAVLFRMNYLSASVEFSLLQANIPFLSKDPAFAMRTPVRYALAAIRLALDPHDDEAFILYCACVAPRSAGRRLEALQKQQIEIRDAALNRQSNKVAALRAMDFSEPEQDDDADDDDDELLDSKAGSVNQSIDKGANKANVNKANVSKAIVSKVKSSQDDMLAESFKGTSAKANQLQKAKEIERQVRLDSKIKVMCEQASLDPSHKLAPSLYELAQEMKNHPTTENKKAIKFFAPLLEHIDEVQYWSDANSLGGVINFILEQTGIFRRYAKDEELDNEDLELQDDLANIQQLVLLGSMIENDDEATLMSMTASIKAQLMEKSPNVDYNNVANLERVQQEALEQAKKKFEAQIGKQVQNDPCAQSEAAYHTKTGLRQRMQLRQLVFQLLPECHAPWAKVLRTHRPKHNKDDSDKVQMLSIHASKGKEFQAVILIGCENKILPYLCKSDGVNKMDEERRLAYVAFTRAKRYLFITFSRNRLTHKGAIKDGGRSIFVKEALSPWQDCPRDQRPFRENLIRAEDFNLGNVWKGRIDR